MRRWLWAACLVAAGCAERGNGPDVPLPEFAAEVRRQDRGGGAYQVSFEPWAGFGLDEVRDFYGRWAAETGWRLVSPTEESWSSDTWEEFEEGGSGRVRQRLTHWVDPTGTWSLRLALREQPPGGRALAHVLILPFANLDQYDDEAPANHAAAADRGLG